MWALKSSLFFNTDDKALELAFLGVLPLLPFGLFFSAENGKTMI